MEQNSKNVMKARELRQLAEKILSEKPERIKNIQADDIQKQIHELAVYQIELEIQNEELRKTRQELEALQARYFDLYNFTPVGYVTIDKSGLVSESNHTGAYMLGAERNDVIQNKFSQFIAPESQDIFYHHRQRILESGLRDTFELKLVKKDGTPFYAQMECIPMEAYDGKLSRIRALMIDISERKKAEEQIRKLTHQLIKTQENERHMISLELHDCIAQDLIGLKYACETLLFNFPSIPGEVKQMCLNLLEMLEKSISEVRNLSYDLRPPGLDKLGLVKTLYQYASEFSEKTCLPVDFHSAGMEDLTLDYDTKINLYRLIQEGLNNVRKHADASHVTVKLVATYPNILLRILDDGKGFDVEERMRQIDSNKKMGLRSMEERALLLNGKMTIQSKPAKGTKILIEVPFVEKTHEPKKDHTDR